MTSSISITAFFRFQRFANLTVHGAPHGDILQDSHFTGNPRRLLNLAIGLCKNQSKPEKPGKNRCLTPIS
jgi:hypothetical protein